MKTPEQMAEDWLLGRWYAVHDPTISGESKVAFLAGYKAAQQWISVKDRLPPDGAKVLLIVFGDIHYGWIDQSPSDPTEYCLYFSNTYIDKGHHALTHWMPIPKKPKYMSDYVEYEPPKEEK